jgi:hypothetical protein
MSQEGMPVPDREVEGDIMSLDFMGGDPAHHVIGKAEEKPARVHAPQKPKPKAQPLQFEARLLRDIRVRKEQITPRLKEIEQLEAAEKALKEIKKNGG